MSLKIKRSHKDDAVSNSKKLKAYNDLEPDFINYLSVPSLESMCIVSIVAALFKQSDVKIAIREHSMEYDRVDPMGDPIDFLDDTWTTSIRGAHDNSLNEIEKKILDKVDFLPIPSVLKVKVFNVVKPIQLQILMWIFRGPKDIEYIDSIFWSSEGTIDKIKTLKHLTRKESNQYVIITFCLACRNCLEESIYNLWNKLPDETKKYFLCGKSKYIHYDNHLLAYWTHNIRQDLSVFIEEIRPNDNENLYDFNDSIYKNMFKVALRTNNILAVKYFWNKLTCVEISSNLTDWVQLAVHYRKFSRGSYQYVDENADVLYFLLSKMNGVTEQNEILQKNSKVILNSLFLDWPWQRFLLPTINLLWEHIDDKYYVDLLNNITQNINERKTTEYLFSKLWSDSPVNLKKHFVQNVLESYSNTDIFCNLLIVEKIGTIQAILEYANMKEQNQIIFSFVKNKNFINVVDSDKLHSFDELCLDLLSQSDIKCIKERIAHEHGNNACQKWVESGKWDKLETFLNWAFNTHEQIEHFKNEIIKKVEIIYSLIHHKSNYELANKFLSWCYDSEVEIHNFKIHFAKSKPRIIEIGCKDWHLFEKFVDWCFNSDEEVQNFKSDFSQSPQMMKSVYSCIADDYEFDLIENVINWCFNSQEEIKEFKAILALSDTWMNILQKFVSNEEIYDSDWNNWELIRKLLKLVSPLDENVIIKLKEKIASEINFECCFLFDYTVQMKDLFCLLDNDSYDIEYGDYSNDELCDDELVLTCIE